MHIATADFAAASAAAFGGSLRGLFPHRWPFPYALTAGLNQHAPMGTAGKTGVTAGGGH